METAIQYLGQEAYRFVLPFWWAPALRTTIFRGIPIHYEAHIGASYEPRLEGVGVIPPRIRERVDAAFDAMERQYRIVPSFIIVPAAWCRILSSNYRGRPVFPARSTLHQLTDARTRTYAADYAVDGEPRVEAPLAFGSISIPIHVTEEGGTMDEPQTRLKELPKEVTDAFELLINKELQTKNPGRFARVAAVAELAQQLAALYFTRVEDLGEDRLLEAEMDAHPPQGRVGAALYNERRLNPPQRAGLAMALQRAAVPAGGIMRDNRGHLVNEMMPFGQEPQRPEDIVRDFVSTAMPMMRMLGLNNLLTLRGHAEELGLDRAQLDRQIKEASDAVAHSDLLRRHEGGDGGREDVQGDRAGRDAGGAPGPRRSGEEGQVEPLDPERPESWGEHDPSSSDGEGGPRPGEGAEAGQAGGERSPVQQRQDRGGDRVDLQGRLTDEQRDVLGHVVDAARAAGARIGAGD